MLRVFYAYFLILMIFSSCRISNSTQSQITYNSSLFPLIDIKLNQSDLEYTTTNINYLDIDSQVLLESVSITQGSLCVEDNYQAFTNPYSITIEDNPGFLQLSFQGQSKGGFPSACITKTFYIDRAPPIFLMADSFVVQGNTSVSDVSPLVKIPRANDVGVGLGHFLLGVSNQNDSDTVGQWDRIPIQTTEIRHKLSITLSQGQSYYSFLIAVDKLGNQSLPLVSNSWMFDEVPPQFISELETDWFTDLKMLPAFSWLIPGDIGSGINYYEYSWGTQIGLQDILNWTSTQNPSSVEHLVNLNSGVAIYPSVKAIDRAGNQTVINSNRGVIPHSEWEVKSQDWDITGDVHLLNLDNQNRVLIGGEQVRVTSHHRYGLIAIDHQGMALPLKNIGEGFNGPVYVQKLLADGKMLIGGQFSRYNGQTVPPIIRVHSDLQLDKTFQVNFPFSKGDFVYDLDLQLDKIVIVGDFSGKIMRLNTNGLVDPIFLVNAGFNDAISSVRVHPDTLEIFCVGSFTSYKGQAINYLARLDTLGNLVNWISPNLFNSWIAAIAIHPDGSILLGGSFSAPDRGLVKLFLNGTLDPAFQSNKGVIDYQNESNINNQDAVYIDQITIRNSALYIAGFFSHIQSHPTAGVAKLSISGSVDVTFALAGHIAPTGALSSGGLPRTAMHVVVNNALIPSGSLWIRKSIISDTSEKIRFLNPAGVELLVIESNPDQKPYTTFNFNNISNFLSVGNEFYIAGDIQFASASNGRNYLLRILENGALDLDFINLQALGFDAGLLHSVVEFEGKYFICGSFRSYNSISNSGVISLDPITGQATSLSVPDTSPVNAVIECQLQREGNNSFLLMLVQSGQFQGGQMIRRFSLNQNQMDTQFLPVIDSANDLSILRVGIDGSFYFSGRGILDSNHHIIQKYNSLGAFDSNFGRIYVVYPAEFSDIQLDSSSLTIAGNFSNLISTNWSPSSFDISGVARISHQGALNDFNYIDPSMMPISFGHVSSIQPMGANHLFAFGFLFDLSKNRFSKLMKLNNLGQIDSRFKFDDNIVEIPESLGFGFNFEKMLVQPNGKIWLVSRRVMQSNLRSGRIILLAPK